MRASPIITQLTRSSWWLVALTLLTTAPVAAQQSPVVAASELDAALADHSAAVAADRAAVQATLARPEVAEVASDMGVDLEQLHAAAGSLSGEDLASAVAASSRVDQALAGGQVISFNAITLIIILLLVIIVVLIAN